jgi:hypothetical protein
MLERAGRGGKKRWAGYMARIYGEPCSDVTARCAAAKAAAGAVIRCGRRGKGEWI